MIRPEYPPNEATRLARLHDLEVLDSAAEAEFDALARAASLICGTPISLLSLLDRDRQWFKANVGLEGTAGTPRDQAFCAHAILGDGLMEVQDATLDARFRDNPLVTGGPEIRFYAGVPVVLSDGSAVGTLCVIDRQPRALDAQQRAVLAELAAAAAHALEGRQAVRMLASVSQQMAEAGRRAEQSEQQLRLVLDNAPSMLAYWDRDLRCRFANQAYRAWFGADPERMVGTHIRDLLGDKMFTRNRPLLEAALAGEPQMFERVLDTPSGPRHALAYYTPDVDADTGSVHGILAQVVDVTLTKRNEAALREYREHAEAEAEIARFLLARMSRTDQLEQEGISYCCLPAEGFSGDLIAVARSQAGDLYGMLVDSTGHGLSAAIHLVPVTSGFYDMAERGFTLDTLARRLNQTIKDYSPPDRFVALSLVRLMPREHQLEVMNAGNPAALLVGSDRSIRRKFHSGGVPLGILDDATFRCRIEVCDIAEGETLLLCSDGLTEACAPDGRAFGASGLSQAISTVAAQMDLVEGLQAAFSAHCQDTPPGDDVTVLALRMLPASAEHETTVLLDRHNPDTAGSASEPSTSDWDLSISFSGTQLQRIDVVPVIMDVARAQGLDSRAEAHLYRILHELVSNAIDHGLLGLDSSLKAAAEGFSRYYTLRTERLQALSAATLRVSIRHQRQGHGGRLDIEVKDSGPGFDHPGLLARVRAERSSPDADPAPRGLALLLTLCDHFKFTGTGNVAEAMFRYAPAIID